MFIPTRPRRQRDGPQECQVGEPPELHPLGGGLQVAGVHVGRGGHGQVERRHRQHAVGVERLVRDGRIACAGAADDGAALIHRHQTPRDGRRRLHASRARLRAALVRARHGVCAGMANARGARLVLERGQHVPVIHPDVGVRVGESREVAERRQDARLARRREVEQPRAPGGEAIGQEMSVGGHLMLRVMRMRPGASPVGSEATMVP